MIMFLEENITIFPNQFFLLQKFGDIEDLQEEDSPLSVVLTFKSRSEAENVSEIMDYFFPGSKLLMSAFLCFKIELALILLFQAR